MNQNEIEETCYFVAETGKQPGKQSASQSKQCRRHSNVRRAFNSGKERCKCGVDVSSAHSSIALDVGDIFEEGDDDGDEQHEAEGESQGPRHCQAGAPQRSLHVEEEP